MALKHLGTLLLLLASINSWAEDSKLQAKTFSNLFSSVCLKNIYDLGKLREQLKNATPMGADETRKLLKGSKGNAWVVPDNSGAYILALHEKSQICTVIAHHADANTVEEAFLKMVNNPIAPLETKKVSSRVDKTTANGKAHTTIYEWQAHNGKYKLEFVLSTSTFEQAEIQAFGRISLISDGE